MELLDEWTPIALKECFASYPSDNVLMSVLPLANRNGLWLEFGVFVGTTLRNIVSIANNGTPRPRVAGFDSFNGLPEDWRPEINLVKGHFGPIEVPSIPGAEIVPGWFNESLSPWLSKQGGEKITFVHIDCDLYSSAKYVLTTISPFLIKGSIIVFDELLLYNGFEKHEWKALYECSILEKLFDFDWLAHFEVNGGLGEQAAIRII
jgi:hypothetical protein